MVCEASTLIWLSEVLTLLLFDTSRQLQRAFQFMVSSLVVVWSNSFSSRPEVFSGGPVKKFPSQPYNKYVIDQACSVKMAEFWPRFVCRLGQQIRKRSWPTSNYLDLTLGQ